MVKPGMESFKALLDFLEDQPHDFRPICRWLMLGGFMAQGVIPEHAKEPTLADLLDLLRLLRHKSPDLIDTATLLTAASPHAEALPAELQLDLLVERDPESWNHPVQILPRPRKSYVELLEVCQRRIEMVEDDDEQHALYKVALKLERAIVLEERAERRRNKNREEEALKALEETPTDEGVPVGIN